MQTLRDQACIVGVGETAYTRGSQKSVLRLVLEASRHAMADAGVTAHDIDGFVLPGPYLFQEQLAANLGINLQQWVDRGLLGLHAAKRGPGCGHGDCHLRPRALWMERLLRSAGEPP